MLIFPNAKINIGLNVVSKRSDGFHNLETVFYPIGLSDILEFVEVPGQNQTPPLFINSGIYIKEESENLCVNAYNLIRKNFSLPNIKIHLHKKIPIGAGLGGGSSDAAYMLKMLNEKFKLNLSKNDLIGLANKLGSDCAFFIDNHAVFANKKGENLYSIQLSLEKYFLVLVFPYINISTVEAYSGIIPKKPDVSLNELIKIPIKDWRNHIKNDFEDTILDQYPEIKAIKQNLYKLGATYSSMSGSGSSVYGIFRDRIETNGIFNDYILWTTYL